MVNVSIQNARRAVNDTTGQSLPKQTSFRSGIFMLTVFVTEQ